MEICNLCFYSETVDFEGWCNPYYTDEERVKVENFFKIEGDKCFDNPMEIVDMCRHPLLYECQMLLLYDSEDSVIGVLTAVHPDGEEYWDTQVHILSEYKKDWEEYFNSFDIRDVVEE